MTIMNNSSVKIVLNKQVLLQNTQRNKQILHPAKDNTCCQLAEIMPKNYTEELN